MLWAISAFAVFAVSLGVGSRARATLLARIELREALGVLALSAVEKARAVVMDDPTPDMDALTDDWATSSKYRETESAAGNCTAFVEDEERKVSLNKAEAPVLARLFESAGLARDEAEELAQCVLDWRDQDSNFQHPQYGAEDSYYADLAVPYASKDAPFDFPEELLLIKGMKREIFDKIRPFVTAHGTGVVNLNTAPRPTLEALGLETRTVDKILTFRAGGDAKEGTADDVVFIQPQAIITELTRSVPPLDGAETAALSNLILAEKVGTVSSAFLAKGRAVAPSGAILEAESVFERTGKTLRAKVSGVQWPSRS